MGTHPTIGVTYRSVDGVCTARAFKTIQGARKFAHRYVGEHPDVGRHYAVSFDGVGRIECDGCTLDELFPADSGTLVQLLGAKP